MIEERVCRGCTESFQPWRKDQNCCSAPCRVRYQNRLNQERKVAARGRATCEVCGADFDPIRGRTTCSKPCYDKTPERRTAKREADRRFSSRDDIREWRRAMTLRNAYGITVDDYQRMLRAQEGCCAICGEPPPGERPLVVDHDHITGAVRSLLCNRCNPGLGLFRDNPDLLMAAAAYLETHAMEASA